MITASSYASFLEREYLREYIPEGGAAVKFAVPGQDARIEDLFGSVRVAAAAKGFAVAAVDADAVKVHMVQEVFYSVARQIDWEGLASLVSRHVLQDMGFRLPSEDEMSLESIAEENSFHRNFLNVDFSRQLEQRILKDYAMAQEFRHAMFALCRGAVDTGAASQTTRAAVLDWLKGDLRRITALKDALIYQRIGRHNARHMLFSLAHWLRRVGRAGLILTIDVSQLAVAKRTDAGDRLFYTKAAVLDAYEVIRQIIDGTDELRSCLVLVGCARDFLSDATRGIEAYHALHLRIADEVHDRNRPNPFAALVRLSPSSVVVA